MIPIGAAQSMATMQAETSHLVRPTGRNATPSPAVAASLQAASLPAHAVALSGLTKIYRGRGDAGGPAKPALDKVDLTIPRGALYGLLGPNGAGKSTLINILAGLVLKTAGRAVIWGIDIDAQPRQARAAIGVVPQELNIDPFFTPREMLDLHAGFYGVPKRERRTDEILDAVGLLDKADSYARTLSGGMRRRLLVAKALVHSPPNPGRRSPHPGPSPRGTRSAGTFPGASRPRRARRGAGHDASSRRYGPAPPRRLRRARSRRGVLHPIRRSVRAAPRRAQDHRL